MSPFAPNASGGMDALSFVSASLERKGDAARSFSDFAINGRPLHALLGRGRMSVFGALPREVERSYARLLWPKPHMPSRAVLYVCAQCGDLGCGYFGVLVRVEDDSVVWSDPGCSTLSGSGDHLGPWRDLWFDRVAYRSTLGYYL